MAYELQIDGFAGFGGMSEAIEQGTGRPVDIAINHDPHAIQLHERNHPSTRHYCAKIQDVDPATVCAGRPVRLLHMSPDCRHFSRAKGSAPVSASVRSLAWEAVRWAEAVHPTLITIENVPEFETWGPLLPDGRPDPARSGETFRSFCARLVDLGYTLDRRVLNAADFGAPTRRLRLFLIARRDGKAIHWPVPTHGPAGSQPYRTAGECIDWSIPAPSILTRARPLAPATCRRIAAGLVRYVVQSPHPYIAPVIASGSGSSGLVAAWMAKHYTGVVGSDLRDPLGTITAVDHHSLCVASLDKVDRIIPQNYSATVLTAFLVKYYREGGQWQGLDEPMHTITTRARLGLVTAQVDGQTYAITDIGLRMLQPRELARGQGFRDSYQLAGTKAQQIARIGNSVPPPLGAAVIAAQAA